MTLVCNDLFCYEKWKLKHGDHKMWYPKHLILAISENLRKPANPKRHMVTVRKSYKVQFSFVKLWTSNNKCWGEIGSFLVTGFEVSRTAPSLTCFTRLDRHGSTSPAKLCIQEIANEASCNFDTDLKVSVRCTMYMETVKSEAGSAHNTGSNEEHHFWKCSNAYLYFFLVLSALAFRQKFGELIL